jgi:chemosensory pili system protein ChpA (sensor histidine kinase/response regulator)
MLGIHSIQRTAHSLEDYFKILKENPTVKVDQKLETLFLNVFDALQELLEQLQGPFGLTEDIANQKMANVEPVFGELDRHLQSLVAQVEASAPVPISAVEAAEDLNATYIQATPQESALVLLFQRDVPARLRDMLQLFKQSENQPGCREQLQDICRGLESIGDQFNLTQWCQLLEIARLAISNPDNNYRTLAPLIIKDIKHAQDLVLEGRFDEILACEQLQELVPQLSPIIDAAEADLASLFADEDVTSSADDLFELHLEEPLPDAGDDSVFDSWSLDPSVNEVSLPNGLNSEPLAEVPEALDHNGPEVGMAELNSLADLFEGEVPDLGSTWQEEEIIADMATESIPSANAPVELGDVSNDFADLLFEADNPTASDTRSDAGDLIDLFGDSLQDDDTAGEIDSSTTDMDAFSLEIASNVLEDIDSFDGLGDVSSLVEEEALGGLSQLFDDDLAETDVSLTSNSSDQSLIPSNLSFSDDEVDLTASTSEIGREIIDPWDIESADAILSSEMDAPDLSEDEFVESSAADSSSFGELFGETVSGQSLDFSEITMPEDDESLIELLSEDETDYSQLFEDSEASADPRVDEIGIENLIDEPSTDSEIDALVDQAVADLEMEDLLGSASSDESSIEELSLSDADALDDSLVFELNGEINDSVTDLDSDDSLVVSELTADTSDLEADLVLDDSLLFEEFLENSENVSRSEVDLGLSDSLSFSEFPSEILNDTDLVSDNIFASEEGTQGLGLSDVGLGDEHVNAKLSAVPDPWNEAGDRANTPETQEFWSEENQPDETQQSNRDASSDWLSESMGDFVLDEEDVSESSLALNDGEDDNLDALFDPASASVEDDNLSLDMEEFESFTMADSELEALESLDFSTNLSAESGDLSQDPFSSEMTPPFDSMDSSDQALAKDLDALFPEGDLIASEVPMVTSDSSEFAEIEDYLEITNGSSTDLGDLDDLFAEEAIALVDSPSLEDDFFAEEAIASTDSPSLEDNFFAEEAIASMDSSSLEDDFFAEEAIALVDSPSLEDDFFAEEAIASTDSPSLEDNFFAEEAIALVDSPSLEDDFFAEEAIASTDSPSLEDNFFAEEAIASVDSPSLAMQPDSVLDSSNLVGISDFSSEEDLGDLFGEEQVLMNEASQASEAFESLALGAEEMELLELHSAENGLEGFDLSLDDNSIDTSGDLFDLELHSETLDDATDNLFESSADLDELLSDDLNPLTSFDSPGSTNYLEFGDDHSSDEGSPFSSEIEPDLEFLSSDGLEELNGLPDLDELLTEGMAPSADSLDNPGDLDELLRFDNDSADSFELTDNLLEAPLDFEVSGFETDSEESSSLENELLGLGEIEALGLGRENALDGYSLDVTDDFMAGIETPAPLEVGSSSQEWDLGNEFDDLDALLDSEPSGVSEPTLPEVVEASKISSATDDFADLEALLEEEISPSGTASGLVSVPVDEKAIDKPGSEFDDLDKLLEDANEKLGGSPAVKSVRGPSPRVNVRKTRPRGLEQLMRVPVKHLDNLSNLVGELVVNRNSLEQDQERLRQSLDNLLYQVQQLSDVGQRMQDLYERSLLESSLLASRQGHRSLFSRDLGTTSQPSSSSGGVEYDPLEMDRFTGFHSLSQEMIELIVRVRESASDIEFIVDETDQVTRMFRQVTTQLQEGLTRSRMIPFAQMADRLPRAVRDNAIKYKKQATLRVEGRETLIDKMILDQLTAPGGPLDHLINNAIAHGIEVPEIRQAAGKPPAGQITVSAFHQGNQTVISISDDGAGVDIDRVKAKAVEKGLITPAESRSMSRLDVYELLFHPGFSTKDQADDLAGRGVGMDVVLSSLGQIRGSISTDSSLGKGTTFTIRLPLTLSISKALCCISDRSRLAFPMDGVEDMLDIPRDRVQTNAEGQPCISWRDTLLPLRPLNELLTYNRHLSRGNVYGGNQEEDMISVVVLRSSGNFLALQVDQVLGEQEIVIKQLEGPVPKPVGVAGATVLGDGRIMPIADVLELIDLSMGRIRRDVSGTLWDQSGEQGIPEPPVSKSEPMVLIVDDSITVRELLSMTFNKVGYRVEQARDGQEAWEKLRSGLPCDIVFCDIEMPRMDGLELLSRIQKDPSLSHLPIAMLTSRGADRHRQMAASLGASGYFTKPYLEEALLDAAQRMLKGEVLLTNAP